MSRSLHSFRGGLIVLVRNGGSSLRSVPNLGARSLSSHLLLARGDISSRVRHVVARRLVINDARYLSGDSNAKDASDSQEKDSSSSEATTEPPTASQSEGREEAKEGQGSQVVAQKYVDEDGYYEETESTGSNAMYLGFLFAGVGFFGLLAYYLWPRRMGANSVFSNAFDVVRVNDEILAITGDPMKAFGRDVGRSTEGRRNFVDSRTYVDSTDGSNRTRVRFNVKGPKGQALVWAEVSDKMPDNEYVYLICQDKRTGRVVTIEDNRDRLLAIAQGASQAGQSALAALAGVFNKGAAGTK